MSSWLERLTLLVGPRGYHDCMRRSLQSVILFEAKRCIEEELPNLKPFQRKIALMDQANGLIESLPFLMPHQREEILWRTATSKEQLNGDIAYKRIQQINKELQKLAKEIKKFITPESTHQDWVNHLEQFLFESSGDNQGKATTGRTVPANWAHGHNHVILCFRLYYNGDKPDPTFPAPMPPRPLKVPQERPKGDGMEGAIKSPKGTMTNMSVLPMAPYAAGGMVSVPTVDPLEQRRKILTEVREHLDLLKEFEGIISEEDLAQRKRDLFKALPPAPPPAKDANKRPRLSDLDAEETQIV
uniref:Uncharacterized protein n=1 Tax=Amphora coffeiformis TaxID=265554 RepID=A0A7S3P449_9STRA|mmetsp:Transcript_3306/g.6593  ORF Transcript_3306/g.6593 Transcript_3306/m.6593 type:complete len:300 (-) Transcript_3306:113-1012(-)